jgi:hypothetical protein
MVDCFSYIFWCGDGVAFLLNNYFLQCSFFVNDFALVQIFWCLVALVGGFRRTFVFHLHLCLDILGGGTFGGGLFVNACQQIFFWEWVI